MKNQITIIGCKSYSNEPTARLLHTIVPVNHSRVCPSRVIPLYYSIGTLSLSLFPLLSLSSTYISPCHFPFDHCPERWYGPTVLSKVHPVPR